MNLTTRSEFDSLQQPQVPICPQFEQQAKELEFCGACGTILEPNQSSQRYLSHLARIIALDWFHPEIVVHPAHPHLPAADINGSALLFQASQKAVVLLPTLAGSNPALVVPDYWINSGSLVGDYFFCVQIAPHEHWLKFVGYQTHIVLKQGQYDNCRHTYTLPIEALISDIAVFSVINRLKPTEITQR